MPYSHQPILNIAEICAKLGVNQAVLSPGSRVAPLTLAFTRHSDIQAFTIPDERVAAFVALGMSQRTEKPTVLACTSGTASLNYGPAIAEAFYQQIPLLIFTADRPPEWIDQQDGQAIRQIGIHQNHCKASFRLPADYSHPDAVWHIERIISEAVNLANSYPKGPVHINAPFREPFYPALGEGQGFDEAIKVIEEWRGELTLSEPKWSVLLEELKSFSKILIVAGQERQNPELAEALSGLEIPVIADVISNLHEVKEAVKHQDAWLKPSLPEDIANQCQPELLITFGKSVISKSVKLFLRKYKPKQHWHIQPAGEVADTFQSLTRVLRITPNYFFSQVYARLGKVATTGKYSALLKGLDEKIQIKIQEFFSDEEFGEFYSVKKLIDSIPQDCDLHLANSMAVRYANFIGLSQQGRREVFANRGTSGIDGSSSTMIGNALMTDRLQVLITGDLSFFYDRNAFWHKYLPRNARIVLLNNQGGVIFRMIEGSARQPELEEYFETPQSLTAESLANEFGFSYHLASAQSEYEEALRSFFELDRIPKILEIKSSRVQSGELFKQFKEFLKL